MTISKRDIVGMLMARGDHQRAIRADDELPERVHVELHAPLLRDLGLDPALLERDCRPERRFTPRRPAARRHLSGRAG